MRRLLSILLLCAVPATGQVASRDFVSGDSDYISVADATILSPTSGLSVAIWVNVDDYSASNYSYVGKYGSDGPGGTFFEYELITTAAGTVLFTIYKSDSTSSNVRATGNTGTLSGEGGNWHFLVGTWDGSDDGTGLYIYTDGVDDTASSAENGTFTGMCHSQH